MSSENHYILYFTREEYLKSSGFGQLAVENSRSLCLERESGLRLATNTGEGPSRDYAAAAQGTRRSYGAFTVEGCGRGG